MDPNAQAVQSDENSSIHWYSYGKKPKEPQEISLEFLVLNRLLPDIRLRWPEETGLMAMRAEMELESFPVDIRMLMSKDGKKGTVDHGNHLLRLTSEILEEFDVPGSNRRAALFIACAIGKIGAVERITQEYEEEGASLPLHRMIAIAMENSQVDITIFCLRRGATIDNAEARYAAWLGRSVELFELLFPYDIFHLKEEPEYIQQLLKDLVDPLSCYPADCISGMKNGGREVFLPMNRQNNRDLRPLFDFLLDRGATMNAEIIDKGVRSLPYGVIERILQRFDGTLDSQIERLMSAIAGPSMSGHPKRSDKEIFELFSLLIGRVSDSFNFSSLLESVIRYTPAFIDVLIARGASLTDLAAGRLLHMAVLRNNSAMVSHLLSLNMPPNVKIDQPLDAEDWAHRPVLQYYPLHYAVAHKRVDSVRLLLEHGAQPWLQNKVGQTAFEVEVIKGYYTAVRTPEDFRDEQLAFQGEMSKMHRSLLKHTGLEEEDPQQSKIKARFAREEAGSWTLGLYSAI